LHVREIPRAALPANVIENLIQRTDFTRLNALAGTVGLRQTSIRGERRAKQKEAKDRRKIPHRAPFIAQSLNSA